MALETAIAVVAGTVFVYSVAGLRGAARRFSRDQGSG